MSDCISLWSLRRYFLWVKPVTTRPRRYRWKMLFCEKTSFIYLSLLLVNLVKNSSEYADGLGAETAKNGINTIVMLALGVVSQEYCQAFVKKYSSVNVGQLKRGNTSTQAGCLGSKISLNNFDLHHCAQYFDQAWAYFHCCFLVWRDWFFASCRYWHQR